MSFLSAKRSLFLTFPSLQIPYSQVSVVHVKVIASILALLISCSTLNSRLLQFTGFSPPPRYSFYSLYDFFWSCKLLLFHPQGGQFSSFFIVLSLTSQNFTFTRTRSEHCHKTVYSTGSPVSRSNH